MPQGDYSASQDPTDRRDIIQLPSTIGLSLHRPPSPPHLRFASPPPSKNRLKHPPIFRQLKNSKYTTKVIRQTWMDTSPDNIHQYVVYICVKHGRRNTRSPSVEIDFICTLRPADLERGGCTGTDAHVRTPRTVGIFPAPALCCVPRLWNGDRRLPLAAVQSPSFLPCVFTKVRYLVQIKHHDLEINKYRG